ncbi:hypothetical protein BESB_001450 [Besnoitia besnoiti]|uniref:Leucine rich repeat-containing protein n=1 Tax=Besnoitia besnoiti TaxID=94643 RepID=A0A2A9MP58_BESBE|nr:hypothetical protein BESB_001450 [Besnoitia besnoiti]PFH37803.1 hypothetical protein BESB_001450 [Besnoitia besnoiti]
MEVAVEAPAASTALNVPLRGSDSEMTDIILRRVVEVFPQTAEMKRLMEKRLQQEQRQRAEVEARRELELKEEVERLKREEDLKKLRQQKKKQRDIEERMRMEEEMKNREDDNLARFLRMCLDNATPAEMSFSGLGFTQVQIRVLVRDGLALNRSIVALDLSRAGLTEEEGPSIAQMLTSNKALVKLDLDGNHFGLASAKAFRKALEVNDTLRSLNVENCSFTCRGDEQSGIAELARGLRVNKGLRNLNLRNNQIDDEGGDALLDALAYNKTLIQLDLSFNDLTIDQLREVHELINRNHALFTEVKKHEKRERRDMHHEEALMRIYLLHLEARRISIEGAERRRIAREKAYEDRKAMMSRKKNGKGKKKGKGKKRALPSSRAFDTSCTSASGFLLSSFSFTLPSPCLPFPSPPGYVAEQRRRLVCASGSLSGVRKQVVAASPFGADGGWRKLSSGGARTPERGGEDAETSKDAEYQRAANALLKTLFLQVEAEEWDGIEDIDYRVGLFFSPFISWDSPLSPRLSAAQTLSSSGLRQTQASRVEVFGGDYFEYSVHSSSGSPETWRSARSGRTLADVLSSELAQLATQAGVH